MDKYYFSKSLNNTISLNQHIVNSVKSTEKIEPILQIISKVQPYYQLIESISIYINSIYNELLVWYEQNINTITKYSLVFEEIHQYDVVIEKLVKKQFICVNLPPALIHKIYQGADVDKVVISYYFDNDEQNMKKLIQRCSNSSYMQEYQKLYNQILRAYDREDFLLACIGSFSLVDGLFSLVSGINGIKFKKRLENIVKKIENEDKLNIRNKKIIYIYHMFHNFEYSIFKDSNFSEDEPQTVNRHWAMHGRTKRKYTKIDFLKILLWIDTMVYLFD